MTVIHKKCNAVVKSDAAKALANGMIPGDWGFCTACGERVDHLVWRGSMKDGCAVPEFSDEVVVE